jgi:hypothetical protein
MSAVSQESQTPAQEQVKQNDKEYNFAQIRRQLEEERYLRQQAEERAAQVIREAQEKIKNDSEDDNSNEPYVDEKRLAKKLERFEKTLEQKFDRVAEQKARALVEEERRVNYLKQNNDFNEIMSPVNIEKFAERHPALAENILRMPEGFERQKLVYENIKALGVHRKEEAKSNIQEKIDQNRRSPYYQPTGASSPPYASQSDFSDVGQKNAYAKMQELKKRLRI